MPKYTPIEERFLSKFDVDAESGCWVWNAATDRKGYGRLKRGRHHVFAHRYAWEYAYGSIPDGLFVCHHCDNPPCVNVAHLFLGTNADNVLDMKRKGRVQSGALHWTHRIPERRGKRKRAA